MKALYPLLCLLLLLGCDMINTDDFPDGHPTTIKHHELSNVDKLIAIPYPLISVQWLSTTYKNRETSDITVLMEFSAEDKQAILDQSEDFGKPATFLLDIDTYQWLPDRATRGALFKPYLEDYMQIAGPNARSAELFTLNNGTPYIYGNTVSLNDGYILLRLNAR